MPAPAAVPEKMRPNSIMKQRVCGGMPDRNEITMEYGKSNMDAIREMWDEIFADPKEFADYYFEEICRSNKILTAYYGKTVVGMLHLNPYRVSVFDETRTCYYIVGVAVKEDMRRQGIMRAMMEKVLEDMKNEGCLFAFLMPERKEYYQGMGFETVYSTRMLEYDITEIAVKKTFSEEEESNTGLNCRMLSSYDSKELDNLAEGINNLLAEIYDIYAIRDRGYLASMVKEHICQNGDVCVMYGENLAGLFSYDIHDTVMYVERFEPLNTDIDNMLEVIIQLAADKSCCKCIVTVPGHHAGLSGSEGHGIMAYVFDNSRNISMDSLKNNSFFDEIV